MLSQHCVLEGVDHHLLIPLVDHEEQRPDAQHAEEQHGETAEGLAGERESTDGGKTQHKDFRLPTKCLPSNNLAR